MRRARVEFAIGWGTYTRPPGSGDRGRSRPADLAGVGDPWAACPTSRQRADNLGGLAMILLVERLDALVCATHGAICHAARESV